MTPITYTSEQPVDYAKAIDAAPTLSALKLILADWRNLAADAEEVALKMTAQDFRAFRRGLKKERSGTFAGESWSERFAAVLVPERMFKISMTAAEYKVPFGLAYIRLKETGNLP